MPPDPPGAVVVADVGKTSIRAEYRPADGPPVAARVAASGVLGEPGAAAQLVEGLAETVGRLPAEARDARGAAVGIAGYLSHPELRAQLRAALRGVFPQPRLELTSDLVLAHLGALAGGPGTVLVAGTGAVALAVGPGGEAKLADGLGPLLGDDGGGAWIGREGAIAAIRGAQGRGPRTILEDLLERDFGRPLGELPGWLARRGHPVRDLAAFAPLVLAAWQRSCPVATAIAKAAAGHLAATAVAAHSALDPGAPVASAGSLLTHRPLRELVAAGIAARLPAAALVEPAGGPLDGAALLCDARAPSLPAATLTELPRA